MGLKSPSSGRIKVNAKAAHLGDYSQVLSYVPSKPCLIIGTVNENLRAFAKNRAYEAKYASLIVKPCFRQLHKVLPADIADSLDHPISASSLSAGQLSLFSLLRALVRGPEVLVVDEFSRSLDIGTERKVLELLDELNLTVVAVTHSPQVRDWADRALDLSQAKKEKAKPALLTA